MYLSLYYLKYADLYGIQFIMHFCWLLGDINDVYMHVSFDIATMSKTPKI